MNLIASIFGSGAGSAVSGATGAAAAGAETAAATGAAAGTVAASSAGTFAGFSQLLGNLAGIGKNDPTTSGISDQMFSLLKDASAEGIKKQRAAKKTNSAPEQTNLASQFAELMS